MSEIKPLLLLFSDLFLHPLSREIWDASSYRDSLGPLRDALPGLRALVSILDAASDGDWGDFEAEFHALFSGTRFPALELWESCYRGARDKRLMNRATLETVKKYRGAGLSANEAERHPPDHIGIECAFFAYLCNDGWDELRGDFFAQNLGPFAAAFGAALEERSRLEVYRTLARALRESAELLSGSAWTDPASDDGIIPGCLRRLSEAEAMEAGDRKVPVCGINNCGGKCPLAADVSYGCVLSVRPSDIPEAARAPGTKICVRGAAYPRTFLSGQRLRYPLKRIGPRGEGLFARISWDEAIDEIAAETVRIGREYGPQSRYVNYSTGVTTLVRGNLTAKNLLALDGGFLDYYNTYSTACTSIATPYTYGTNETGNSAADLLNSKLIILWGHNPLETGFGSTLGFYLREAKRRGIEIISVDPRQSDTALELASRWIPLRPATDSALMDAMAFVILSEGLQDQEFMDRYCVGFDSAHMPPGMEDCENYRDYAFGRYDGVPKTPEWASAITGVEPKEIRRLARKYAGAKPAALLQGFGPQRHGNGEQSARSSTMLACLTGNVGVPGGSAAGCGNVRLHRNPEVAAVRNPYSGRIPVFLWTDAVARGAQMTAKDGVIGVERLDTNIKMIFNLASNTLINQHSDVNRSARILRDESLCEYIVCSDLFMTPSARFADILLPGVSMFEVEGIGKPWREGDYLTYSNQSIEPLFECRQEFCWLSGAARRMGHYDALTHGGKDVRGLLEESYNDLLAHEPGLPDFETFRERGVHFYEGGRNFIAFEKNIKDPENNPFPTPSGRIEIFSPRLRAMNNPSEIPAIPKYVPSFEGRGDPLMKKYPFQLIGWHTRRRTHSTHDNNADMDALEPHMLWINAADARERGISDGEWVDVFNDRGRVRTRARVTERILRGVLAMSQGGWHAANEAGVDVGGCVNTLSTARPTPLARGNPQHSNLVDIEASAV
jgi:anaerobic dimethyl sulfoxide reductase subunit A